MSDFVLDIPQMISSLHEYMQLASGEDYFTPYIQVSYYPQGIQNRASVSVGNFIDRGYFAYPGTPFESQAACLEAEMLILGKKIGVLGISGNFLGVSRAFNVNGRDIIVVSVGGINHEIGKKYLDQMASLLRDTGYIR